MKSYELMLVIKPDLAEADAKKVSSNLLESFKSKEAKEDFWGKRKLAYKINNYPEAYYTVLTFTLEPEKADVLKTELNLNNNLLRYLLTTKK